MASKIRLEEVAQRAGVSLTTASMVMTDQGRISPATKERVIAAAAELGYTRKARGGVGKPASSRNIAVLFDIDPAWAMTLQLIRPVISELEAALRPAGYNTLLIPISRSDATAAILEKIRGAAAIGVAMIHFTSTELLLLLETEGIPSIIVMNSSLQDRFFTVCVDDFQGAYEGASFMIRSGHRGLGYVDCDRPGLPVLAIDRFFGFKKAVEEYRLAFDDTMRLRLGMADADADGKALAALLREHPAITALFALDDGLALRVSALLSRQGKSVPGDVSLLAPGDMADYSESWVPGITTMRIDTAYMGRVAAQMLASRIAHSPGELHVLKVKQHLVDRGSVRKLR